MYEAIIDAILRDDLSAFESQYLVLSREDTEPTAFDLFMFDENGLYNLLLLQRTEMLHYLYRLDNPLMKCLVYRNLSGIELDELEKFWSYILDNGWHLKYDPNSGDVDRKLDQFIFANLVSKHFRLLELSVRKGVHLTQLEAQGGVLYLLSMSRIYEKTPEVIRKMLDDPLWRNELFSIDHDKALCLLIKDGYLLKDVIPNIPHIVRKKQREIEECKIATSEIAYLSRDVIEYCIHPYI